MLSVADALNQVLEHARAKPASEVALGEALGLVLAEDVASDVDSPPHDKSMVDGYALLAADVVDGRAELAVLEEITAGTVPTKQVTAGNCSRIMTGAPLPDGADAVVMVERTNAQGNRVEIRDDRVRPRQNIMRRGKSLQKDEVVLRQGVELGPAEIGLLTEVGRTQVPVIGPVQVAIVSTGNELVPASEVPGAGQIRNSNGPLLAAAVKRAVAVAEDFGIVKDEVELLRRAIGKGLDNDVLVISGGVSAGVLDLVPAVLKELGVRKVFHKVHMKPGKPLWFGVYEGELSDSRQQRAVDSPALIDSPTQKDSPLVPRSSTLVFGLPGNPVSSLVCFELFVKPAIARLAGRHWQSPHVMRSAKLTEEFSHRGDRPTYHPAKVVSVPEGLLAEPTAWQGSADLRGFAGANALIAFPAGDKTFAAGDVVELLML